MLLENQDPNSLTKAIVFFDSNLPKMEDCSIGCEFKKNILCKHRLPDSIKVVYCNTSLFSGLPDVEMTIYFIHYILSLGSLSNEAGEPIFIVLTHDEDFITDVKRGWIKKRQQLNPHLALDFYDDSISALFSFMDIRLVLKIKVIKTVKCGTSRDKDRRQAIEIVNKTIIDETRAS